MTNSAIFKFQARWADMDFNGHMKNTAYLDYSADCRLLYFKSHGFSMSNFKKLQIGPVVLDDHIRYFNEIMMYQGFSVKLQLQGINEDGSRFRFFNIFKNEQKNTVATVLSNACWFDLVNRKIKAPPEKLLNLMVQLEKTKDFRPMESRQQN